MKCLTKLDNCVITLLFVCFFILIGLSTGCAPSKTGGDAEGSTHGYLRMYIYPYLNGTCVETVVLEVQPEGAPDTYILDTLNDGADVSYQLAVGKYDLWLHKEYDCSQPTADVDKTWHTQFTILAGETYTIPTN